MLKYEEFRVTSDHLKLLQRLHVVWTAMWEDAYGHGVPCIDPKRPYGNSGLDFDIGEILGEDFDEIDEDEEPVYSQEARERYLKLHQEMGTVLQIALASQSFSEGLYRQSRPFSKTSWVKVEGT